MLNKQEQYPFSPWTVEWEALKKIKPEERFAILQNTEVWDEAERMNSKINLAFLERGPKRILERIKNENHPRYDWLVNWLQYSRLNLNWFKENIWTNFDLVSDWIMLLWDVFELENETIESIETNKGINGVVNDWKGTKFTFYAALDYAKKVWKIVPTEWHKYKWFLPWSEENKINFLIDVLWLQYNGVCYPNFSGHYGSVGYYCSSKEEMLYISPNTLNSRAYGSKGAMASLRCIKKKN